MKSIVPASTMTLWSAPECVMGLIVMMSTTSGASAFAVVTIKTMMRKMIYELSNAPMQYRNHPEQAISCADREDDRKCGATYATERCGRQRWNCGKAKCVRRKR